MSKARQVMRASVDAFNAHDEERLRSLYADDVVFEAPGGIRQTGANRAVEYALGWLRAFPDGQLKILTEVANDEWVAHRFAFEGTHEATLIGPQGEIPATNRRLTVSGVELVRVEDGVIVENYVCFDQAQVLTELGAMPELALQA